MTIKDEKNISLFKLFIEEELKQCSSVPLLQSLIDKSDHKANKNPIMVARLNEILKRGPV